MWTHIRTATLTLLLSSSMHALMANSMWPLQTPTLTTNIAYAKICPRQAYTTCVTHTHIHPLMHSYMYKDIHKYTHACVRRTYAAASMLKPPGLSQPTDTNA